MPLTAIEPPRPEFLAIRSVVPGDCAELEAVLAVVSPRVNRCAEASNREVLFFSFAIVPVQQSTLGERIAHCVLRAAGVTRPHESLGLHPRSTNSDLHRRAPGNDKRSPSRRACRPTLSPPPRRLSWAHAREHGVQRADVPADLLPSPTSDAQVMMRRGGRVVRQACDTRARIHALASATCSRRRPGTQSTRRRQRPKALASRCRPFVQLVSFAAQ